MVSFLLFSRDIDLLWYSGSILLHREYIGLHVLEWLIDVEAIFLGVLTI